VDPNRAGAGPDLAGGVEEIYRRRFAEREHLGKERIWPPIVAYLQRFIDETAPVLDIACDRGYFIRNVRAEERWASDIRDVSAFLPPPIRFICADGLALAGLAPRGHFGTVFTSNYLEHLPNADAVIEQLRVAADLLRPGGRVIVLQPNLRAIGAAYWDFIDHRVPLTEHSLVEAGRLAGLAPVKVVPRFLPYSTKGRLPLRAALVRAYLRVPIAWRVLGAQTLYVAQRAS
jgi:SAM-dependent methyltransferase